jgi:uncharacterized membrane protein YqjE
VPARRLERALGGAQVALAALAVVGIVAALGWPAERTPAVVATLFALGATGVGWSIAQNVDRYVQARERGVYRVRKVT